MHTLKELLISTLTTHALLLTCLAGFYAGVQNTIAGGGSFVTFPTLILAGLSPLDANITSTLALFPAQITSGVTGYKHASGLGHISLRHLILISLIGGFLGAYLLLSTSPYIFSRLVPWLLLFATTLFAYGSFRQKKRQTSSSISPIALLIAQFTIAIYGGYFGAGIGFLMLAALTLAGQSVQTAAATKNALAMTMNFAAILFFSPSQHVHWIAAFVLSLGGIAGSIVGSFLLPRLPDKILRIFIVCIGFSLTTWMFIR